MKKLLQILLWATIVLQATETLAQDPQFSQYYNAPLFLNPAFAGTAQNTRAALNYRVQWPNVTTPFVSYAASADHFIEPYNSGIGVVFRRDQEGDIGFRTNNIGLIYSYHVNITDKWKFVPALQASYMSRGVDAGNMTFGDQIDDRGYTGAPTGESFGGLNTHNLSFATGGLVYNPNLWVGFSAFHLNRPDLSFFTDGSGRLDMRYTVHGGYKFNLTNSMPSQRHNPQEISITPTFLYMRQGVADRFDVGAYAVMDPVLFGFWYRGLPVKKYNESIHNHESLVFMAGFRHEGLMVSYSYDVTISKFTPASGGAHELSVIYSWELLYNKRKRRKPGKSARTPFPFLHQPATF
ncbi:type IX secretion system membrane protein PorP/SprF [Cytophagaceae bacterium ABcell3]|nr:type IX secretion system membrane protein PorP/SprF [Cytophagaceae bacterium ABcell3]